MSDKYYIPQDDKVIEDTIEPSGEISYISLPGGHRLSFGINEYYQYPDPTDVHPENFCPWYQFDDLGRLNLGMCPSHRGDMHLHQYYYREIDFMKMDVDEYTYETQKMFRYAQGDSPYEGQWWNPDWKLNVEIQLLVEVKDNQPTKYAMESLSRLTAKNEDGTEIANQDYDCVRLNKSHKHPGYTFAFVKFRFYEIPFLSRITIKAPADSYPNSIRWSRELAWRTAPAYYP